MSDQCILSCVGQTVENPTNMALDKSSSKDTSNSFYVSSDVTMFVLSPHCFQKICLRMRSNK